MNTQLKLIIPLLDEELSPDLFTPEAGFLNAYDTDINRPFLDNHIFLMYDSDLSYPGNYKRNERIMKMKNLHNRIMIRIKGILVMIYTFCITKLQIKQLLNGRNILNDDEKYDILEFWNKDITICMALITNKSFGKLDNAIVPEQDYIEPKDKRSAQILF